MEFFPEFILQRNRFRGTPHRSIALATGIPIAELLLVRGEINILGDMYAFGLLGAFTVTCVGLDIIRYRERKAAQAAVLPDQPDHHGNNGYGSISRSGRFSSSFVAKQLSPLSLFNGHRATASTLREWIALAGAYVNYVRGRAPVVTPYLEGRMPESLLAVLAAGDQHNGAVIDAAINHARGKPVVFLYLAEPKVERIPQLFEVVDPYLEDEPAKDTLKQAALLARKAGLTSRFVYRSQGPGAAGRIWQIVHPRDVVLTAGHAAQFEEMNPDRIRFELTPHGKIAHLLKHW
jgi:hypothetical protein